MPVIQQIANSRAYLNSFLELGRVLFFINIVFKFIVTFIFGWGFKIEVKFIALSLFLLTARADNFPIYITCVFSDLCKVPGSVF